MAAPTYQAATRGLTDATGGWSFDLLAAENGVYILQVLQDGGTAGAVALTGWATGCAKLDGAAGWDYIGAFAVGASNEAIQHLWICRFTFVADNVLASGTNSTSEDLYGTAYRFQNVSAGATLDTVIENVTAGATVNSTGTSNTASDASVTTRGPDRLALNFIAVNDDNAIATFTGQTGGTWSTGLGAGYAESSGTDGSITCQHATVASVGTIDGGTASITDSDAWGVVGFALIGTTPTVARTVLSAPTFHAATAMS